MSERRLYRTVACLSLLVGLSLAAARPARAQESRRLGIVITTEVNISPAEADGLAMELARALHEVLPVDVIAGAETRRRLPPGGLPEGCVAEPACREDLGQRLDAAELLLLVVVRIGDRVQIDPTWAHVASGQVTSRGAVVIEPEAAGAADRAAVLTRAAPRLLPHLEVRSAPPPPSPPEGPRIIVMPAARDTGGRHMTAGAWLTAGAGAAALVGGAIFGLSAQRKFQSLEDGGCREQSCPRADVDALERHALAADALLATAAVAGVATLVLYLRSAGEERAPGRPAGPGQKARAAPGQGLSDELTLGVGPGGGPGLSLGGTF